MAIERTKPAFFFFLRKCSLIVYLRSSKHVYIRTTLNRLSDERQGGITAILIIIKRSHEIDREFGGAWE